MAFVINQSWNLIFVLKENGSSNSFKHGDTLAHTRTGHICTTW